MVPSRAPTPAGLTPGSSLAELMKRDCHELLMPNGREVDLSALLSPDAPRQLCTAHTPHLPRVAPCPTRLPMG